MDRRYLVLVNVVTQSLKAFDCSSCSLTSADIIALMNYLKTANVVCENLTFWDLSNNNIDEEGVSGLAEIMPELFPNLKCVDNVAKFFTLYDSEVILLFGNLVAKQEVSTLCKKQLKVNS